MKIELAGIFFLAHESTRLLKIHATFAEEDFSDCYFSFSNTARKFLQSHCRINSERNGRLDCYCKKKICHRMQFMLYLNSHLRM